jgi:mannitol-1-phosphate/altronate dehydrogenase
VVTITVSEAGYVRGPDGHLDRSRDVITADIAALQDNKEPPVSSLPGKLVAGLLARRAADAGPVSILSCDNLPENGEVTMAVVTDLAGAVDDSLLGWMEEHVDFATSMVDRITPETTAKDRSLVARAQGYEDASPVPTEPFAEWVISGRFPGRTTGMGQRRRPTGRGHHAVRVDQLSRIAADGSVKLPVRIVPPLIAERADGLTPVGCATAIAAWILHLRGHGAPVKDPGADRARTAAEAADDPTAVSGVLETLHSGLGDDSTLVRMIIEQMGALTAIPPAS